MAVALGADATFIARTLDKEARHLQKMLERSHEHKGTSLLEIYQNCNIFNDNAFDVFGNKASQKTQAIFVEHGQPLVFGDKDSLGIKLDGHKPIVVNLEEGASKDDLWIHDETDLLKAQIMVRFFESKSNIGNFPRPLGVIYAEKRELYEQNVQAQIIDETASKGLGNLNQLLQGKQTWQVN